MYLNKIGTITEATSTTKFKFIVTDESIENEKLVFSYVEIPIDKENNEKLIGRIVDAKRGNPLLNIEQAGALTKEIIEELRFNLPPSRFTFTIAECEVVGLLSNGKIEQNRKPIPLAADVYPISDESIKALFYEEKPNYIPIGKIEGFGGSNTPITINGDELVTKHFAIFGMTGSGKTNTSAKLLEELIMRGYPLIIFDPHDDYKNITNFEAIFEHLKKELGVDKGELIEVFKKYKIDENNVLPLLQTISLIYNIPIWEHLIKIDKENGKIELGDKLKNILEDKEKLDKIIKSKLFELQKILDEYIEHYNVFPEIKYYGEGFGELTLRIMEGFLGEGFSDAQRRYLRRKIKNLDKKGEEYIKYLEDEINSEARDSRDIVKKTLSGKLNTLKIIYKELEKSSKPLEIDEFLDKLFDNENKKHVYRFSLSSLPENIRKILVYAIVTYIFRSYKFKKVQNYKPILFILEEARSLIPSNASPDKDLAGWLAVRALRDLAYEGRKFKLAYGIISQKPSTVDAEVSSQCNTLILHQLKSPDDQQYVKKVTEGLTDVEIEMLKNIGTGKAVITGTAVRSTALVEIFRRYSKEGIEKPTPLTDIVKESINKLKEELEQYLQ